jgi:sulfite exporter TauE/SafE
MLGSITPLGERGRGRRWGITVSWFFIGSTGAGAAVGASLGAVGALVLDTGLDVPWSARLLVLAALALVAIGFDTHVLRWELPGPRRQVNENWLYAYRGWFYGATFGLQLGAGVTTFVTTAAVYLTLAAAFLTGDPVLGGALGAAFGLGRAVTLLPSVRVKSVDRLAEMAGLIEAWEGRSRTLTAVAELGAVLAALLVAVL